jgi:sorting nexin-25
LFQLSEDKEMLQFVLVVHVLEDELDNDSISTGWVVLKKLSDFQELHRVLWYVQRTGQFIQLKSLS